MEGSEKEQNKRQRTVNFTSDEKILLVNIVAKYKDVIENKKTDAVGIYEKNAAWEKITLEFNSSGLYCPRSCDSLRRLYDNKKKQVRKQAAEQKREIFKTGGGLPSKIQKDACDELLISIMNRKSIHGLTNDFDSDVLRTNPMDIGSDVDHINRKQTIVENYEDEEFNENDIEFVFEDADTETGTEIESGRNIINYEKPADLHKNQWKKYKPFDLKRPITEVLRERPEHQEDRNANPEVSKKQGPDASRRRPATIVKALSSSELAEKYVLLLDKRLVNANYEEKKLQNDLQNNQKEHELRVESLKLDIEIKKKSLESISQQK